MEKTDGKRQDAVRPDPPALASPANLPADADDDDVDRASHHGWRTLCRHAYATFQAVAGSFIGRLVLFGYTWALLHHMLGGLRHLIWDTGHGFGPAEREWAARATLFGSITLTLLLWIFMYVMTGGLR